MFRQRRLENELRTKMTIHCWYTFLILFQMTTERDRVTYDDSDNVHGGVQKIDFPTDENILESIRGNRFYEKV